MSDILNKFVEDTQKAYGSNLKTVLLYGSKASGEDVAKKSDYNILMILEDIQYNDIKVLNPCIGKWIKQGNPPPLLFTMQRFKKSADVFPIEFLDMKDNHRILYGDNPFKNLDIRDTHLRHECEFELKGKLLKLRQGYMVSQGKPDKIRELLISSISAFLVVFRHVIRLLGKTPPVKKLDALNLLAEQTKINPEVFVNVMKMKAQDKQTLKLDPDPLMKQYLEEIEKVVDIVDNL